jgi:hypothetical protein
MHLVDAGHGLPDHGRELASRVHPLLVGGVGPLLQEGNDHDGHGVQGHADQGHQGIEVEQVGGEGQKRQEVGHRNGDGLAHELAGVGHLGHQGLDHHARRGLAEKGHGQGQDMGVEFLSQIRQDCCPM